MNRRWYYRGLIFIIIGHLLILSLFAANIIPQQTKNPNRVFWFHQGGDNYGYFAQARAIYSGEFSPNRFPLGFPIMILPALWFNNEATHDDLLEPIALFWSTVMYPIAIVMLAWLTQQISQGRWLALLAAGIFALLPILWFLLFNLIWNAKMAEIIAIHSTWAQMLSDGPTAFFTLLAVVLFILVRKRDYALSSVILLGAILGFVGMIRFTGLLIALVIGGLFLLEKRWREVVILLLVALIFFAPQMIYNLYLFDSPFTTGYSDLPTPPPAGLFNVTYLLGAFAKIWERLGILTLVGTGLAITAFSWIISVLWRKDRIEALLIAGWFGSYAALYSIYYYSWTGALMRFMIPVMPVVALLGAVLIQEIVRLRMKKSDT
jgi:hypothetical protein